MASYYFRPAADAAWTDLSGAVQAGCAWSITSGTVTVISAAHGMAVGDIVAVTSGGVITSGDYVLTGMASGAFTFAFTHADNSGTLSWSDYVWYSAATAGVKRTTIPASAPATTLDDIIIVRRTCSLAADKYVSSLSGTGGGLQSSVPGVRRLLRAWLTGLCVNMTFQDISMGSAARVDAKSGCSDLGNNIGIVFRDIISEELLRSGHHPSPGLDDLSGAAHAYGFSRLFAAYTGAACVVRRTSGTLATIGFNADGALDEVALLAHCAGTDGFVTTWYDQVGSANATQATTTKQPKLVSAGVVNRILAGSPAAVYDTVDDFLQATLPASAAYHLLVSSWSESQIFPVVTVPTGATMLPAAGLTRVSSINAHSMAFFTSAPPESAADLMNQRGNPDLSYEDLFRLQFYTAGAKILIMTAAGAGVTYIDAAGTQSDNYSRTVALFDWIKVRAIDPSKITIINWVSRTLSGSFPQDMLDKLSGLTYLAVSGNRLTGPAPNLANHPGMTYYHVGTNQMTGPLPDPSAMPLLTAYYASFNQFSGPMISIANNPLLNEFSISNNSYVTGPVPDLTPNPKLTLFGCRGTSLTGSIPDLSKTPLMSDFQCYSASLTGTIPSLAGNPALVTFYCHAQNTTGISGTMPSLSANTLLANFNCSLNVITGNIPDLSANVNLVLFDCQSNLITGYVGGLSSCVKLTTFTVKTNHLTQAAISAIVNDLWTIRTQLGALHCAIALEGASNGIPTADAIAKINGTGAYLGDGLKQKGCTVTYRAS